MPVSGETGSLLIAPEYKRKLPLRDQINGEVSKALGCHAGVPGSNPGLALFILCKLQELG